MLKSLIGMNLEQQSLQSDVVDLGTCPGLEYQLKGLPNCVSPLLSQAQILNWGGEGIRADHTHPRRNRLIELGDIGGILSLILYPFDLAARIWALPAVFLF